MNTIKFYESNNKSDIAYAIIDKTSSYAEAWNKEIAKNVSDMTIHNITSNGYTVYVSLDEEQLLKELALTNIKYLVVMTTGTELTFDTDAQSTDSTGDGFMEHAEKICRNTNFFLIGHVLDRKEWYYELHPQTYIINLDTYRQLGCPELGQPAFYSQHTQLAPNRSSDNVHDDYTPLAVSAGINKQLYLHKCHGWNILSIAFKNNLPVLVFDETFRNNKKHYYPEHPNSFLERVNFMFKRYNVCASAMLTPFNSDNLYINKKIFNGPLDQLITTSSGLNWVQQLEYHGYKQGTVVKFYDYNLLSLKFMKDVIAWDGNDYAEFCNQAVRDTYNFLENRYQTPIAGPKNIKQEWSNFQKEFNDWNATWKRIKELVSFEFHQINLLDSNTKADWINSTGNTLVNVTNIFNYVGTAPLYSVKSRVNSENIFLTNLNKRNPNAYVIFAGKAAHGFVQLTDQWPMQVKDVKLTNIESLQKPTWHMNADWTNTTT